jgi:uncharacterized membrane protein (DUF4010 family)
VAVATSVSFMRVLTIAAVMQPRLLLMIAPSLVSGALVAIGFGLVSAFWRRSGAADQPTAKFRNPFGFWSVVGFAIFLAAIIVLGRMVGETFGAAGAIVGAIAVGLVDVDSLTISMARLTPKTLALPDAGYAILAAVVSNTVSKTAIGAAMGRGRFAAEIAVMAMLCIVLGGAALALTLKVVSPG